MFILDFYIQFVYFLVTRLIRVRHTATSTAMTFLLFREYIIYFHAGRVTVIAAESDTGSVDIIICLCKSSLSQYILHRVVVKDWQELKELFINKGKRKQC